MRFPRERGLCFKLTEIPDLVYADTSGDLPARSSRARVWVVAEIDKMRTAATREGRAAVATQLRVLRDALSAIHTQSTPAALVGTGHLRHSTPRQVAVPAAAAAALPAPPAAPQQHELVASSEEDEEEEALLRR